MALQASSQKLVTKTCFYPACSKRVMASKKTGEDGKMKQ